MSPSQCDRLEAAGAHQHCKAFTREWHLCWSVMSPPPPPPILAGMTLAGFLQTPGRMILQPYSLPVSKWLRSGILVIDCNLMDNCTIDPDHDRDRAQPYRFMWLLWPVVIWCLSWSVIFIPTQSVTWFSLTISSLITCLYDHTYYYAIHITAS